MMTEQNNTTNRAWTLAWSLVAYLCAGTVSTLISVYLPVIVNELKNSPATDQELGSTGAYVSAIFLYGWMIGGILLGWLSDRIGRKKVLALASSLFGIATVMIIIVSNWQLLIFYRFISGIGIGGTLVVSTVLISEIWPAKSRAIVQGILSVSFPVGIVATGGLNLIFTDWRQAFWLGIIPVIAAIGMMIFIKESFNYTKKEAASQDIKNIFDTQIRNSLLSGSLIFGAVLIGLWGLFSWMPTWVQTILPAGHDGNQERGLTMMLLGSGGITGGILSGFVIRRYGDRKTLMIAFAGLTIISCILFLTNGVFSKIVYIETVILALFFGISQGALSNYIPELFPSTVRASSTGFCFNIGRFFTATAVFFVGSLVTILGGFSRALLLFSLTFIIALIATYRTNNQKINHLNPSSI
ncbi:MAG: MFS transporter [Saprospiraceae bacterium]